MYVNGGVEFRAALVQVNYGLYWQRSRALSPIKGEVPALTAGRLTLEPERTTEEHTQSAV